MIKKKQGFTLIELLVVVAIIGVLTTTVVLTVGDVRAKARDIKRMSDMDAIYKALILYENVFGHYPLVDSSYTIEWDEGKHVTSTSSDPSSIAAPWADFAEELKSYLPLFPKDPVNIYEKPTSKDTVHVYSYTVYLDNDGKPSVRWFDKETCSLKNEVVEDGIPVRAFLQSLYLESMEGNEKDFCETLPNEYDTFRYIKLLP